MPHAQVGGRNSFDLRATYLRTSLSPWPMRKVMLPRRTELTAAGTQALPWQRARTSTMLPVFRLRLHSISHLFLRTS